MKKFFNFFRETFSSKDKLVVFIIDVLFVASVFSFFMFTNNERYLLTWVFFSLFTVILFFRLFLKEGIKINHVVLLSFIYITILLISYVVNGFMSFNFTDIILIILFNVFYQYFIFTNNFKKVLRLIYISLLLFLVSFLFLYYKEIFDGNVDRIGGEIANVNIVGFFFTIGFVFAIYNVVFKRNYYEVLFAALFLGLALLTGSKKVIINFGVILVLTLIIFFGKKKWYFSLGAIVVSIVLFILILNMPQFNEIKKRFLMFLNEMLGKGGEDESTILREYFIKEAFLLFLKRPLFGWGFNGYARYSAMNNYSHNNFTELLANFGIIGFMIFEYLLIAPVIQSALQLKKEKKENIFIILLGSVLFITQLAMVINDSKVVYLCMALLNAYSYNSDPDKNLIITYRSFQRSKAVVVNE